jgi:hypothetical protein
MQISEKNFKNLKIVSYTLLIIIMLISIGGLTLSAYNKDNPALPSFRNLEWKPLSKYLTYFLIFIIALGLIGVLEIFIKRKCFQLFYIVLIFLGVIISASMGFASLISYKNNWVDIYLGCDTQIKSLSNYYQAFDTYIHHVDQNLCTKKCKCYFKNETIEIYKKSWDYSSYFSFYSLTEDSINSANQFRDCPTSVINLAYDQTNAEIPKSQNSLNFNSTSFYSFISDIEIKYKCTGICVKEYYNTIYKTQMKLIKYLFSEINNGPPSNIGCLNLLLKDINGYLPYYGVFSFLINCLLLAIFLIETCFSR